MHAVPAAAAQGGLGQLHISLDNLVQAHWMMGLVGYAVVFLVLVSLAVIFTLFQKGLARRSRKARPEHVEEVVEHAGDVNAAIAMALHLYTNELHDLESAVLTIERRESIYRPWSSKIYGLRGFGQRPQRPSSFRLNPKRRSTDR